MRYTIIREKDFEKARKEIKKNKGEKIIFSSNNDELNRKILEKEDIDILLLNQSQRKDKLKQRDSGLNQVLAKIAKKRDIAIGINLDEVLSTKVSGTKAKILARISQNIKLCNKNKVRMKFIVEKNDRNLYDLKSLGLVLGMSTQTIKGL
jgi:RNase P/RNase MRP subunit p30